MSAEAQRPGRKPRRVLRAIALGLLALVVLVLLLVGGVVLWSTTSGGGAKLKQVGLDQVNQTIAGSLSAERFHFGVDSLVLENVVLRDPEGNVVAEIARVELKVKLRALAGRKLDVERMLLSRPRFYLVQDDRGLNLSRALAAREPSIVPQPEEPPSEKQGNFSFQLERFALDDGLVRFEQRNDDGEDLHVVAEKLTAEASARLGRGTDDFSGALTLGGTLTEPVAGPIDAKVSGESEPGKGRAGTFDLTVAGVQLRGKLDSKDAEHATLTLAQLLAEPATVRGFVPTYPLQVPLRAQGTADLTGKLAETKLRLEAGKARVNVEGGVRLDTKTSPGLVVEARAVDLSELLAEMPKSDLSLTLKAEGGGTTLQTANGKVLLEVPASKLSGQTVGPIRLRASAKDGEVLVPELLAILPGLEVEGQGTGSEAQVSAQVHLLASDLEKLARTFGALSPKKLPRLSGRGALDVAIAGPPSHPGVTASGQFATLRYEDYRLEGLRLSADVPDVKRPLESDAHLELRRADLAGRKLQNLRADLVTQGRKLTADVSTQGFAQATLHLGGTVDPDREGLLLEALSLTYPEATWNLDRPAHLRFEENLLSAEPIALSADRQRLTLAGTKRGDRVEADVGLTAFDLGRLPKAFVSPALGLGGVVDLELHARGRLPKPSVQAKLTLADGQYREYKHLAATLDASYERDRAKGTLTAKTEPAQLSATFDTPIEGLLRRRREPVSIELEVPTLQLKQALEATGNPKPLEGTAKAKLSLSGMANDPRIHLTVNADGLRWNEQPPAIAEAPSLVFDLSSKEDGTLEARLDAKSSLVQAESYVRVSTPFRLGELIAKPPTAKQAMNTPLQLAIRTTDFPLWILPGSKVRNQKGVLSIVADFAGPPLSPVGAANVSTRGFAVGGMNPVDGELRLKTEKEAVGLDARVHRQAVDLLKLAVNAKAPLERLSDPEAVFQVPLTAEGLLGPISLSELVAVKRTPENPNPKNVQGLLRAELKFVGNLRSPQAHLRAYLEQFATSNACLGKAKLALDYQEKKATLDLLMSSTGGGSLTAVGDARVDLSYPNVQKLDVNQVPVVAELRANNFDLAFLSGITPTVRQLGGQLAANVRFDGTMLKPDARANLTWREGLLALEGYGEYRKVKLDLAGSLDGFDLKELYAESGSGKMKMTAKGNRVGNRVDLTAVTNADKFPIVVDDQLLATTSFDANLEGTATDERVNIRKLSIPEAHVYLPEGASKDLQELDAPADVILVKDGVPVDPKVRKALAAKEKAKHPVPVGPDGMPLPKPPDLEPESPPREYWVTVQAPRNLWVHSTDINAEIGLSEGFRIEKAEATQMFGEARVLRGRATALGRIFDLERNSSARFTGPVKTPFLNATANYTNEREGVKVTLTVRGQGKDLKIIATSQPPLSESEIFTLLATGRRTLKPGGAATSGSAQAASIAGSLLASQLQKSLKGVPLDVLSIEAGSEGLAGTRVEGGTYLSDRAYFSVSYRNGADTLRRRENRVEAKFEYQISPRVNFECSYGDARTGGADLVWTRDW